ncbi:MAG: hypothetical protein RBS40_15950 [Rhodocyclaceae bacterium]|jgi:hypothetical protein|nr:hypothetical protein [Rhodocyclaceae bacterium]
MAILNEWAEMKPILACAPWAAREPCRITQANQDNDAAPQEFVDDGLKGLTF